MLPDQSFIYTLLITGSPFGASRAEQELPICLCASRYMHMSVYVCLVGERNLEVKLSTKLTSRGGKSQSREEKRREEKR